MLDVEIYDCRREIPDFLLETRRGWRNMPGVPQMKPKVIILWADRLAEQTTTHRTTEKRGGTKT